MNPCGRYDHTQLDLATLIGLAANNSILIADVPNRNLSRCSASQKQPGNQQSLGSARFLITAIATLAGFIPLVLANGAGAQSRQSLGTVIFGGLVVATVLSLGVIPPMDVLVKNLEQRLFTAKGDTRQSSASA